MRFSVLDVAAALFSGRPDFGIADPQQLGFVKYWMLPGWAGLSLIFSAGTTATINRRAVTMTEIRPIFAEHLKKLNRQQRCAVTHGPKRGPINEIDPLR